MLRSYFYVFCTSNPTHPRPVAPQRARKLRRRNDTTERERRTEGKEVKSQRKQQQLCASLSGVSLRDNGVTEQAINAPSLAN